MMKQFYIRRCLRIFLLYYGVLLVLFLVNPINYDDSESPKANERVLITAPDGAQSPATVQAVREVDTVVTHRGQLDMYRLFQQLSG